MTDPSRTRVVHVNDQVPGAVYIGRANGRRRLKASPWANPYRVDVDGTRAAVISMYRTYIQYRLRYEPELRETLAELVGKPLACWCRHDGDERTDANACHGDVLVEILRELGSTDDKVW